MSRAYVTLIASMSTVILKSTAPHSSRMRSQSSKSSWTPSYARNLSQCKQRKRGTTMPSEDDDDDVPDLVENFDVEDQQPSKGGELEELN